MLSMHCLPTEGSSCKPVNPEQRSAACAAMAICAAHLCSNLSCIQNKIGCVQPLSTGLHAQACMQRSPEWAFLCNSGSGAVSGQFERVDAQRANGAGQEQG